MKNKLITPLINLLTGFVFVCIDALVYCSGGNHWLISKKLKIGAVLISLTGIIACGGGTDHSNVKCYKPESLREDSIAKAKAWEKEEAIEKAIKKAKQDSINSTKTKQNLVPKPKPTPILMKTCYDYAEPPVRDSLNK